MLIKSALVTSASGSVGGMTASRNKGGNYFRARAVPTNPNTMNQALVRESLGMLANMWATLTAVQRASWKAYADNVSLVNRLGDAVKVTALNMFIRSNAPRQQAGLALLSNGPSTFNLGLTPMILDFTLEASGTAPQAVVTTEVGDYSTGDKMLVYLGKPVGPTINYFKGPYRYLGMADAEEGAVTVLATAYPYTFVAGQRAYLRAQVSYADGRLTQDAVAVALATVAV